MKCEVPWANVESQQGERAAALCLAALAVTACAAHPGPIVDRKGVDRAVYERDLAECTRYGAEVQVAAGAAKGAVAGGAYGAAVGSIGGDAAEGAGAGAISGATWSALEADREKQEIVKRCLAGRGYVILN